MTLTEQLQRIARSIVLLGVFLLPIALVPTSIAPLATVKIAVFSTIAFLPLCLWVIAGLFSKRFVMPQHPLMWASGLLVLAGAFATVFSTNAMISFAGYGYERDTFFMLASFVSLLFSVSVLFTNARALAKLLMTFLASFAVLGVFHVVRLVIGADALFPSIFSTAPTVTMLGSWNDLAVLSGLALVAILSVLLFNPPRAGMRVGLYSIAAIATFLLVIVNVVTVWMLVAAVTLFLLLYAVFRTTTVSVQKVTGASSYTPAGLVTGAVCVLAAVFIVFGGPIGERVGAVFGTQHVDVRPSWAGTIDVAKGVYAETPILGVGQNFFDRAWVEHRDATVNTSLFWSTDFSFGVGYIPSAFVTSGVVGGGMWVLFLLAFCYGCVQFLRTKANDERLQGLVLLWASMSLFLLVLLVVYVPHIVVIALAAISVGAFISALGAAQIIRYRAYTMQGTYTAAMQGGAVVVVLVLLGVYAQGMRPAISATFVAQAATALAATDAQTAEEKVGIAEWFATNSNTAQVRAALARLDLQNILATAESIEDIDRTQVQTQVTALTEHIQKVVEADSTWFRNWLVVARTYEELAPLVGDSAYESAATAYEQAKARAPQNPLIPLLQARLAVAQNDTTTARAFIAESLALKENYTDAYFLLSQLEIREGNAAEAIASTENAVLLSPNNAGLRFQLGYLQYAVGNYQNAAEMLRSAVVLNNNYANALYFLGLSLDRLEQRDAALLAFVQVLELNPDNREVQAIVAGLQRDVSAIETLESLPAPLPSERDTLPLIDGVNSGSSDAVIE